MKNKSSKQESTQHKPSKPREGAGKSDMPSDRNQVTREQKNRDLKTQGGADEGAPNEDR